MRGWLLPAALFAFRLHGRPQNNNSSSSSFPLATQLLGFQAAIGGCLS